MWLSNVTSQVWPSGADLAAIAAPIAPAAPGLLSTRICQPVLSTMLAWMKRATGSVEPPGGKGTTNLIGPLGQSPCASTMAGAARVAATLPRSSERRRTIVTATSLVDMSPPQSFTERTNSGDHIATISRRLDRGAPRLRSG